MTSGSILLLLALFLVVALVIIRPFLVPHKRESRPSERIALEAEKDALMARIRALDFDAQTAKQDAEAYQAERLLLLQAAAEVTTRLETIEEDDIDRAIEEAVARLKGELAVQEVVDEPAAGFCPNCGRPAAKGDRFCAGCGRSLT